MLAEWTGLEPATPGVTGRYSNQLNYFGGGKRDRTADLLHAMQALSQLSYTPVVLLKTGAVQASL
jgi:hypothetical protein